LPSLKKILQSRVFTKKSKKRKPRSLRAGQAEMEAIRHVIMPTEPIQVARRDPSWRIMESYYVYKPFVKVVIAETPQGPMYFVEEYGLTPTDRAVLEKLTEILMDEIKPPTKPEDIKDLKGYVFREAERIADKYKQKLGLVGARRIKLLYYIERNLLGYGPIDPLMKDPNIEDISCNGVNIPIYVWHKKYESIPTNITFLDEDYLNEFIMKMAHMAGKHISIAFPILDAMLPEKHRLAATFGREVSVKGPTFTIRKFRERPFSVIEIIQSGELDTLVAAYLWELIEHAKTAMIAGGTGTGKSFPGDTLIIARINGEPRIVRADELYEMIKSREYRVGDHIVKDVEENIEVLSIDNDYKLTWKRIVRAIKHRDNRALVKVVTNSSIITTTIDHNFIKLDPETLELVPVTAQDIREGDYLVNVWLNTDYGGIYRVSPEEAYFLGLWIGDGYLDRSTVCLTTKDQSIKEKYISIARRLYGKTPNITVDKRNEVLLIRFNDENLAAKLAKLFNEKKSYTVRIPEEILFNNDPDVLKAFLAGLFDADGSLYVKKSSGKNEIIVGFSTRSKDLANGISLILKRMRIKHVVKEKPVKNTPLYRVIIYGSEAARFIAMLREYSISREKIEEIIGNNADVQPNPNIDVFPVGPALAEIRSRLGIGKKRVEKELGLSSRYVRQYEHGYRALDREDLLDFIGYYKAKTGSQAIALLDKMESLVIGDVFCEKILRIEQVEPTNEYLYDFEVEDTHNFVIGQIGWRLNHNTTLLNVISMFIKPGMKIVTVEDTPEINLPHPNWVQLTSRESYLVGSSGGTSIRLFDLVKLSLRYRPDYIIVGEVRGEEAFVLFQSLATGHGGLCLPRDQLVLASVNGRIDLYEIGKLVEDVIDNKVKDLKVLTYSDGKPLWVPVSRVVVKNGSNRFVRIHLEGGVVHEVHENHPVIVLENGKLTTKPAHKLKKGDLLVSLRTLALTDEEINEINAVKLLEKYSDKLYIENASKVLREYGKGEIRKTASKIGRSISDVDDWYYGKASIPYRLFIELGIHPDKLSDGKVKYGEKGRRSIPIRIKLDRNFGYILGFFLADGTIQYDDKDGLPRRIVLYPGKDTRLANKFIETLKRIGLDEEAIYVVQTKDNILFINVDSKALALLIYEILQGKVNDYERSVPLDLALRAPEDFRRGIIEGYWDGDGSVIVDKDKHIRINARTVNRKLAESIIVILKSLDILASLRIVDNTRGFAKKSSIIYVITIIGGSSKVKILEILGRRELLKKRTYTKVKKYDGLYIHKVIRTETVEKDSLLYDIEVPGTHMFAISGGLVLTHNSTIHAETLDYAIKRLTSPPMNIPPTYMRLMNIFIHLRRVITRIEKGVVKVQRRVTVIQEVEDFNRYITIAQWDPKKDAFRIDMEKSIHLRDIAMKSGLELEDIIDEIYRKATILNWMLYKGVTNVWDVSRIIFNYYYDPAAVYKRAVEELKETGTEAEVLSMAPETEAAETAELVSGTKEVGEATKELFERTRELGM